MKAKEFGNSASDRINYDDGGVLYLEVMDVLYLDLLFYITIINT